jgi:hypothetical protein
MRPAILRGLWNCPPWSQARAVRRSRNQKRAFFPWVVLIAAGLTSLACSRRNQPISSDNNSSRASGGTSSGGIGVGVGANGGSRGNAGEQGVTQPSPPTAAGTAVPKTPPTFERLSLTCRSYRHIEYGEEYTGDRLGQGETFHFTLVDNNRLRVTRGGRRARDRPDDYRVKKNDQNSLLAVFRERVYSSVSNIDLTISKKSRTATWHIVATVGGAPPDIEKTYFLRCE